jgi:TM2 domain-containing membrane protein YozV
MSGNPSVTEPVRAGQLSPDGRFRWDGGRWVYATANSGVVSQAPMAVSPKSVGLAVIASFFLPGLGSIINGEGGKGAVMLVSYIVLQFLFWLTIWFLLGLVFLPFILGLWVWGMYDGYEGARRWNARHGIVS